MLQDVISFWPPFHNLYNGRVSDKRSWANFFSKGTESQYFSLWRPYTVPVAYSPPSMCIISFLGTAKQFYKDVMPIYNAPSNIQKTELFHIVTTLDSVSLSNFSHSGRCIGTYQCRFTCISLKNKTDHLFIYSLAFPLVHFSSGGLLWKLLT